MIIAGIIAVWLTIVLLHYWLWYKYVKLRRAKKTEYWTDYVHDNLVIRIYKPEFEYHAKEGLVGKMLDEGMLSPVYNWVLFNKE